METDEVMDALCANGEETVPQELATTIEPLQAPAGTFTVMLEIDCAVIVAEKPAIVTVFPAALNPVPFITVDVPGRLFTGVTDTITGTTPRL